MVSNAIRWFEIYVQDMERARKFYETVFDYSLTKLDGEGPEMWAFPMKQDEYGCGGTIVKMEGVPSGGNSTIVYFASEDCAVEEKRVASAGGKIKQSKMPIGEYGFMTLAHDSEGNVFGIHSMK